MNEIVFSNTLRMPAVFLLVAIVAIIVHRRRHRQFPFFMAYAGSLALMETILAVVGLDLHEPRGFNLYWTTQVIYTVLGVLAMHESFQKVLRPYFLGKRWFHALVPGVILVILLLCGWKALQQSPRESNHLALFYFAFYLASDYMRAAIFGLFGVLAIFWQARWQPCAFGVMKGFGLYTIVGMLADLLRSDFGTKTSWFFHYAPAVAYLVACLIWLGAFLQREPEDSSGKTGSLTNVDEVLELLTRFKKALE